jgi:hypothetical protein
MMIPLLSVQDIFRNCIIVVDNAAGHVNRCCLQTSVVESEQGRQATSSCSHLFLNTQNTTTTINALSPLQESEADMKTVRTYPSSIILTQTFFKLFGTITRTLDVAPRIPCRTVDVPIIDTEDKVLEYRNIVTNVKRQRNAHEVKRNAFLSLVLLK